MVESLLSPGSFDIANANRILNSAAVGSSSLARQEEIISHAIWSIATIEPVAAD